MKSIIRAMNGESVKHKKAKLSLLGTGSTLLNLACSGKARGGFAKGKYILLVGDSESGKTWLSLTCLAEAASTPTFNNYRFIYDNGEDGALMDIARYFGNTVAERLEAPNYEADGATPRYSETVEEFYVNVDSAIQRASADKAPFIYILDSENSLSSISEHDKFDEVRDAVEKGKDATGSYGDGKAKAHSSNLRRLIRPLSRTGSILIIISQTRDNLGFGFEKKIRSGGRALKFYATLEIWTSVKEVLKKTVKGKPRQIGVVVSAQVKKNRLTGKKASVSIPIYHSFGIDDVGSCIDYLIDEGVWKNRKGSIDAPQFNVVLQREKLVAHIEENSMESDLRQLVESTWQEIDEACSVKRKVRYE
jgi:RecA/RadA recombinase